MNITMKLFIFVATVRCFVKCTVQDFDGKLMKPYSYLLGFHCMYGLQDKSFYCLQYPQENRDI